MGLGIGKALKKISSILKSKGLNKLPIKGDVTEGTAILIASGIIIKFASFRTADDVANAIDAATAKYATGKTANLSESLVSRVTHEILDIGSKLTSMKNNPVFQQFQKSVA